MTMTTKMKKMKKKKRTMMMMMMMMMRCQKFQRDHEWCLCTCLRSASSRTAGESGARRRAPRGGAHCARATACSGGEFQSRDRAQAASHRRPAPAASAGAGAAGAWTAQRTRR